MDNDFTGAEKKGILGEIIDFLKGRRTLLLVLVVMLGLYVFSNVRGQGSPSAPVGNASGQNTAATGDVPQAVSVADKPLSDQDFRLYDKEKKVWLTLNMTMDDVKKIYGEPDEVKKYSDGKRDIDVLMYKNGLVFKFLSENNKLGSVVNEGSRNIVSSRGIGLNMNYTLSQLNSLYGGEFIRGVYKVLRNDIFLGMEVYENMIMSMGLYDNRMGL